jgi:N-methylhydantoinase A
MSETYRIAVDIGGTFTDLQVLNEATGESRAHKTPTTPDDPSEGLLKGIAEAAERFGFALGQVSSLMHGTTIATNAVLERKLPRGALVTTAGFEDVLEIGRHVRKQVYSMKGEPRALLIPRSRRFGVKERIDARGAAAEPLDEASAREAARRVADSGAEVCAVSLLHAYANPAHERRLAEMLTAENPTLHVSLSSDVSPEIREFERTSTTVLNALLMPVVAGYLARLRRRMAKVGLKAPVYLVQSNGGVTTPDKAAEQPARLLLSGPSGGALAAETLSRQLAEPNLIAVDMGGTSFDVSIVHEGRTRLVTQGEMDGLPVRLPMLEIRTIGAGGGSLAIIDPSGRLRVGPESAGAKPGPACYGGGGELPTVTDANVALGRIDPDYFLGGAMTLDAEAARRALNDQLAGPLGLSLEQAAEGALRVANANMAAAVRLSLFEKGLDPKDFALISFGGAAGLHACDIAAELGCGRVVFPRDPGTLSAWGMLFSDIVHDLARSKLVPATAEAAIALAPLIAELRREGEALLARDGVAEAERAYRFSADFRYKGQAYEIVVPIAEAFDAATMADAARRFHDLHMQQYAHAERHSTPEIVTLRLAAVGRLPKPGARPYAPSKEAAGKATRRICFAGEWREAPVRARDALRPSVALAGPAVIEEPHSTILLPPGWSLVATASGDLLARLA